MLLWYEIVSKLEDFIFRWCHEAHYGHQHARGRDGPTGNAEGATHDPRTAEKDLHGQCTQSSAQRNHRVSSGIQDFSLRGRNGSHDHKLRWYLRLKLDSKYLLFYLTKYLMICRYKEYVFLKTVFHFWLIILRTASKVIAVWELRLFSVYGRGTGKRHVSLQMN